jgi:hypothetical protein
MTLNNKKYKNGKLVEKLTPIVFTISKLRKFTT